MAKDYNTHDAIENIALCLGHINATLFSVIEAIDLLGQRIDLIEGRAPTKPKLSLVKQDNKNEGGL